MKTLKYLLWTFLAAAFATACTDDPTYTPAPKRTRIPTGFISRRRLHPRRWKSPRLRLRRSPTRCAGPGLSKPFRSPLSFRRARRASSNSMTTSSSVPAKRKPSSRSPSLMPKRSRVYVRHPDRGSALYLRLRAQSHVALLLGHTGRLGARDQRRRNDYQGQVAR